MRLGIAGTSIEMFLRRRRAQFREREPFLNLLIVHVAIERKGLLLHEPAGKHESSPVARPLHRAAR